MLKDIQNVLNIVQSEKNNPTALENLPEVNIEFQPYISDKQQEYLVPFFMYTTKIVTNSLLLQNEYIRDDFYFLQFKIPSHFPGKHINLKLTELTSKNYMSVSFSNAKVDKDTDFLIFDNLTEHCFNPKKRFRWIHNNKELNCELYKIEINEDTYTILRYLCFDYFSYENYLTALVEIGYSQKLEGEDIKQETKILDPEEETQAITNAFAKVTKEGVDQNKSAVFRSLLNRLRTTNDYKKNPLYKSKPQLCVK